MNEKDYDKLKQIEDAIQSFNSKALYESSLAFFNALDYHSNKTIKLSPNTYENLINSFSLSNDAINKEKAFVTHWKQIEFIFQIADSEITRIQSLFDSGKVDNNEYQSFLFFAIQLKENSYKRAELVKITRELNLPFKMPVIVLFNYGNKLTLSIIDRRLHKKDSSKDVLEKVTLIKDIDIANPQRAHKEILKDLSLNELYKKFEFHSFVKLHEAWKATLNISELNKKFYKELAYWYFWALQEVEFPKDELKDDKTRNPINVIRLITRLIFVWFLKEKNLVPDDIFNKKEVDKILDYKDKSGSTYYKAILQNLFFATLNTQMNKDVDKADMISRTFVKRNTGVAHYFRYGKLIKDQTKFADLMDNIPFLNGGLFECLDKRFKDNTKDIFIDGFTQQVKNEGILKVPDYLFFTDAPRNIDLNNTFHTKGKKYEVRGLIDILNRYKFTIEENTPVEEEVALDPELLGKVFENLLASYNEETETTARKLTGSFYTPREIVNYMVDESLITYLTNSLVKDEKNEKQAEEVNQKLHHLFSYNNDKPEFTEEEKNSLINAIDNCKILDPACGSGAFPMGILQKLVFVLSKLDPNNKQWKQKQLDKVKSDRNLALQMQDDKARETTLLELDKREEDITKAFDQNNHELDFARKLYLIENCIYGVDKQPVAIQISKLRFFIALIVDQKTEQSNLRNRGVRPLPNLETKFVAADTLVSIEKPNGLLVNLVLEKQIKEKEAEIHKVREKHFRARTPETKEKYRLLDTQYRNELAELLEQDGFPKDATKKLAGWNPYDQNKYADFFDSMWMFEIEKGFDIVIGNPPYVAGKSGTLTKEQKAIYNKQFTTAEYQLDTYVLFTEKGINLCNRKGILTYIIPNTWLANIKLTKIRKYLLENTSIKQIVINPSNIFSEALVDTIILITEKIKHKENLIKLSTFTETAIETKSFHKQRHFLSNEKFIFDIQLNKIDKLLFKRIEEGNPLVKDICEVNRGVHAYRKDGYGITKFGKGFQTERDYLERSYHSIKKIDNTYYPEIRGRNVFPYKIEASGEYISWGIWLAEPREIKYFEGERIYLRKIVGKTLFAAFVNEKNIADQSVYIAKVKKPIINTKYVLAILNSYLLTWYFRVKSNEFDDLFPQIKVTEFKELPIKISDNQEPISKLVDLIIYIKKVNLEEPIFAFFETILNGCIYELYFGEEMKEAEVDILALVEKELKAVEKLEPLKAIETLYKKWQDPKNEVRNRLLLMPVRCPDTIGVIEANV